MAEQTKSLYGQRLPKQKLLEHVLQLCSGRFLSLDQLAAFSGLPKIRAAWEQLGYVVELHDSFEPYDETVLTLSRIDKERGKGTRRQDTDQVSVQVKLLLEVLKNADSFAALC